MRWKLLSLITLWIATSPVHCLLESLMKGSLKKAMKCHSNKDYARQPVIAFSPARYVQIIAMVRRTNREHSCGSQPGEFHLGNPKTWGFCAMGACSMETCYCFQAFTGENCQKFLGRCWLYYCYLHGCGGSIRKLLCSCHAQQHGRPVSSNRYWYDEGPSSVYQPPPVGWMDSLETETNVLYETRGRIFAATGNMDRYQIPPLLIAVQDMNRNRILAQNRTLGSEANVNYIDRKNSHRNLPDLGFQAQRNQKGLLKIFGKEQEIDTLAEDDVSIQRIFKKQQQVRSLENNGWFEEGDDQDVQIQEAKPTSPERSSTVRVPNISVLLLTLCILIFLKIMTRELGYYHSPIT